MVLILTWCREVFRKTWRSILLWWPFVFSMRKCAVNSHYTEFWYYLWFGPVTEIPSLTWLKLVQRHLYWGSSFWVRTCISASLLAALNSHHCNIKAYPQYGHFKCSLELCWTLFSLWHLSSVNKQFKSRPCQKARNLSFAQCKDELTRPAADFFFF